MAETAQSPAPPAPKGRKTVAPGASPGYIPTQRQAPEGRKKPPYFPTPPPTNIASPQLTTDHGPRTPTQTTRASTAPESHPSPEGFAARQSAPPPRRPGADARPPRLVRPAGAAPWAYGHDLHVVRAARRAGGVECPARHAGRGCRHGQAGKGRHAHAHRPRTA